MTLFSEDPAFVLEVDAKRTIHKEGTLTDKETNERRDYKLTYVQCVWIDAAGLESILLAKPCRDYSPDLSKLRGKLRLGVTSCQSQGGMMVAIFSGFEPVK